MGDKKKATAAYNSGNKHLAAKEYDKAIQNFTVAVRWNPDFAIAYNRRGLAYLKKGNIEAGTKDIETSVKKGTRK